MTSPSTKTPETATDPIEIMARGIATAHGADPDFVIKPQRAALAIVPPDGQMPPLGFHGPWWMLWREDAQSAMKALSAAGYAVVPIEPTEEMWEAGHESGFWGPGVAITSKGEVDASPEGCYRAMVAAGAIKP